ncbi:MAG: tetratricopeptide repeat protein [Flavobacterium sp.]|nr:MAG: tetratricopeptide repeat protein [Flavobacterium sp.]
MAVGIAKTNIQRQSEISSSQYAQINIFLRISQHISSPMKNITYSLSATAAFLLCAVSGFSQQMSQQMITNKIQQADAAIANDKSSQNYYDRAFYKAKLNDVQGAIADYSVAIKLDPALANAYYHRGELYERQENYANAIADYSQCIVLDSRSYKAHFARGYARSVTDDVKGAIEDYSRCIGMDPMKAMAYINRGYLYHSLKAYDKAISDFDRALQINRNDGETYANRGFSKAFLKDKTAIQDFDMAIELLPNDPQQYYNRALYRIDFKVKGDFCADLNKALTLGMTEAGAMIQEKCK